MTENIMPRRQLPPPDGRGFLPLSPQVFQVLLSLHDGPQHGYSIIQHIRQRTKDEMRLTASTLYDALARLVDQKLIEEVDPAARAADHDSRRRYYALTSLGREVARLETQRLKQLVAMARSVGI
jgi:DNA-binding PadR family transcriptional regulator